MTLIVVLMLVASALANVVGGAMYVLRRHWEQESLRLLIGAGAGFMLAVSLAEVFPEAMVHSDLAPMWALIGFLFIHLFEHVLTPHFHYGHERHEGLDSHVGVAATAGLVMHSVTDGVAIVAGFQVGAPLGYMILVAAIWHKIPAGFTAASVVGATGQSRTVAMLAAGAVGAGTLLGGIVYGLLPPELWLGGALGVSVGSLLHVAATDLLPEINRRRSVWAPLGVIVGVGFFYLTHVLIRAH